MPIMV